MWLASWFAVYMVLALAKMELRLGYAFAFQRPIDNTVNAHQRRGGGDNRNTQACADERQHRM